MATFTFAFAFTFVYFCALFALTAAQATNDQSEEMVWASVAYIVAGEHTPVLGRRDPVLTPEGAQQMLRQGRVFRTRYLLFDDEDEFPEHAAVPRARIRDMSRLAIDNSQLSVYTGADAYMATSALAFVQGLYPALAQVFPANSGGIAMSIDTATGNMTDYPLDGYQYPVVRTVSILDEEAVYVQGHAGCAAWANFTDVYTKPQNVERHSDFDGAFKSLFAREALRGTLDDSVVNFWNAHGIYDYVDYMYRHNKTVFDKLGEWASGLRQEFAHYALLEQLAKNSDGDVSNSPTGERDRLIPGRTLARQVLGSFQKSIPESADNRMVLMFGSVEPVMAFARLAAAHKASDKNNSTSTSAFLPRPGSALVFELFSQSPAISQQQPGHGHLMVRVLLRPGADGSDDFETQNIFNSTNDMPLSEFSQGIQDIEYDVTAWCEACGAITPFCRGRWVSSSGLVAQGGSPFENAILGGATAQPMSATIGGVIGAAVALVSAALAALAAAVFAGARVRRVQPLVGPAAFIFGRRRKGERMGGGDADVVIAGNGARRDCAGSWELGDAGAARWPAQDGAEAGDAVGISRTTDIKTWSRWKDDAASDLTAEPAKPLDMV